MEWRRCGARRGFPGQLIILMIMMIRMYVMIIMMIMIQRPFDFLDHFDDHEEDQDLDYNIEAVCEDFYDYHAQKTI